jgi:hypothetical protein
VGGEGGEGGSRRERQRAAAVCLEITLNTLRSLQFNSRVCPVPHLRYRASEGIQVPFKVSGCVWLTLLSHTAVLNLGVALPLRWVFS